tara:strand:- start:359 stop:733 length:375 start_codon:yes stop_codon:yes gene_type:complete
MKYYILILLIILVGCKQDNNKKENPNKHIIDDISWTTQILPDGCEYWIGIATDNNVGSFGYGFGFSVHNSTCSNQLCGYKTLLVKETNTCSKCKKLKVCTKLNNDKEPIYMCKECLDKTLKEFK